MAEKIVSPGVFTRENDLSFVQQGVGAIGAAVIGPTVKGPAGIPTQVWSYSEYQAKYGDSFKSGSDYYQYFTSITAKQYLKHGGPLTVVRTLPAAVSSQTNATASVHIAQTTAAGTVPSGELVVFVLPLDDGSLIQYTASDGDTFNFRGETGVVPANNTTDGIYYFGISATHTTTVANFIAGNGTSFVDLTGDTAVSYSAFTGLGFTGSAQNNEISIKSGSSAATPTTNWVAATASWGAKSGIPKALHIGGGTTTYENFTASFHLKTISDGAIMNSTPPNGEIGTNDVLTYNDVKYGTKDNLRWDVSTVNNNKGTFTVVVRRGDDSSKRKVVIETFNGCSLDPQANNYIGNVIGTQYYTIGDAVTAYPFLAPSGSWTNKSKYVYVDETSILQTVDYLDDNGSLVDSTATGSLPLVCSGSFGGGSDGAFGVDDFHPKAMYSDADGTNVQGINPNAGTGQQAYEQAINLLSNQDEYDINLVVMPGINDFQHNALVEKMLTMCETRGDVMTIVDPVGFGNSLAQATTEAGDKDSSYGAMYWPWVQIADPATGRYIWVPQSVMMPGIYAFNDKVSAEWFAPAGLNRGGQDIVVQAERKLTHANRDDLYEANVNPVATFPGEGVVVWGQKTLQKKASALDRVNVRRLLINLKKFIASVSKYLIFENNTAATRNRFLSQVNPYMESVQQRQGLYAFKVVMDESNNTPDVIDRNIMKGDIFIQPAKAAEFIVIDFNIMPTGATFND